MTSIASATIRCLCAAMNWVMETVDIRGSVVGRSRPSNLYTPRRSAVDAVGDKLWAPAPRRGHDVTVGVGGVLSSFDLLPRQSALALEAQRMKLPWERVVFTPHHRPARPWMKNRGSMRNHAKHAHADFRASDRVDGWSPMPRGAGLVDGMSGQITVCKLEYQRRHSPINRFSHRRVFSPISLKTTYLIAPFQPSLPLHNQLQSCSKNCCLNCKGTLLMPEQHRWVFQRHTRGGQRMR
jgi:hypothetical protein